MDREALIQAGNEIFNRALAAGEEPSAAALAELATHDAELVEQMRATFDAARQPTGFFDELVWRLDERFEMCYELMRITFDRDVLDPRSSYVEGLKDRTEPSPHFIMIGRFWRVSGRHRYTPEGALAHFEFDPMVTTESVVSVVCGDAISHYSETLGRQVSVGAIGYMATRPALRGKGGHGSHLLAAFENRLRQQAEQSGEPLHAVVLESEDRAARFWSKMGFRAGAGSRYTQPPLSFDPQTGEPLTQPAPETFMIKFLDGTPADQINRDALVDWVRVIYQRWYSPVLDNDAATLRARALVFDEMLGRFRDSLPPGEMVPLVAFA